MESVRVQHNPNKEQTKPTFRDKTRRERYQDKINKAKISPISLVTINLISEANVGMLIRSAVCFGLESVHVVGNMDNIAGIKKKSASTADFIPIYRYQSCEDFYEENKLIYNFISLELTSYSQDLSQFSFDFSRPVCMIVGHEELGVPDYLLRRSEVVHIDMPGVGHCLNAAVAASIGMFEAVRQYESS